MSRDPKTTKSRLLCRILRHQPELVGIQLDPHGWADIHELLAAVNKKTSLTKDELVEIIETDQKSRYTISRDGKKIRCAQGHSIPVNPGLEEKEPPEILYHGTSAAAADSIRKNGINSGKRNYVHLSKDIQTALKVGSRHGSPYVFVIKTKEMFKDGIPFYLSENNVWLTEFVPARYIDFGRSGSR